VFILFKGTFAAYKLIPFSLSNYSVFLVSVNSVIISDMHLILKPY